MPITNFFFPLYLGVHLCEDEMEKLLEGKQLIKHAEIYEPNSKTKFKTLVKITLSLKDGESTAIVCPNCHITFDIISGVVKDTPRIGDCCDCDRKNVAVFECEGCTGFFCDQCIHHHEGRDDICTNALLCSECPIREGCETFKES